MRFKNLKKLASVTAVALPVALLLAACAGYQPINKNFDDLTTAEVFINKVEVTSPKREVGSRLNAQYMKQLLTRRFIGTANAPISLDMMIQQTERNVSFRVDATVERKMLTMDSTTYLRDREGTILATISTRTDAAYEIQTSPFATQANYDQARESSLENLQRDLQRQVNLFLSDYKKKQDAEFDAKMKK